MARQAHIVSFEDARARSRNYDPTLSLAGIARRTSSIPLVDPSPRDLTTPGMSTTSGITSSAMRNGSTKPPENIPRRSSTTPSKTTNRPERSVQRRQHADKTNERPADDRRRRRAKARADKMFDRQFATDPNMEATTGKGTPRAALYKGEMGPTHRKSTRMQRSSSAGPASAKINPAGWLSTSGITARMLKIATAALCALLTCTFLYIPAQQYYQAQREHDRLAAEYDIIEERNDVLDVQNDILASDAGLEDAVRQKYGYVKPGEQTAVVTGLSDSATDTSRDSDDIEANVLSSSVKSPEEWYTPLLDAFFGVE